MGMSNKDKEKLSIIDAQALEMYKQGKTITEIANTFNVKRQSLSRRLKEKYDIIVLPDGKKSIDSNFFSVIDSPEKAYWLGLFMADGYNSGKNIELCLKDKEHIEKFKNTIKSAHKVSLKTTILNGKIFEHYRLNVKDKQVCEDLNKYGCVNKKSLILEYPNLDAYQEHFIRGYFDGDGSLYYDTRHNPIPRISIVSGSKSFLISLQEKLAEYHIRLNLYDGNTCYQLMSTNKENAEKFLEFIYCNSKKPMRLDRKYNLYIHSLPS